MDVDKYLERIGYTGPRTVSLKTLKGLCHAQAVSVPYSNATLISDELQHMDLAFVYDKIVSRGEAGRCADTNYLFAWCLTELGFDVRNSEGWYKYKGKMSFETQHLVSMVVFKNGDEWIYDFGFKFSQPIKIGKTPQILPEGVYRVRTDDDEFYHLERLKKTVIDREGKVLKQGPIEEWDDDLLKDEKMLESNPRIWSFIYKFTRERNRHWEHYDRLLNEWNGKKSCLMRSSLFLRQFTDSGTNLVEGNYFTRKRHLSPVCDQILEQVAISGNQQLKQIIQEHFKLEDHQHIKLFEC